MTIYVSKTAQIIGDVRVGDGSSIWHGALLRADLDMIKIGKRTNIQDNAVMHLDKDYPTVIGDRVTAGHMAILHGCKVSNDCVIGMASVISNGAVIGDWSIVAPGAVIPENQEFPEGSVIAGVPARVARQVDDRLRNRIDASWRIYYDLARKTLPAMKDLKGDVGTRVTIEAAGEISRILRLG